MGGGSINIHGCAVLIGTRGVLIRGQSAFGKTSLANGLIEEHIVSKKFARWIADDRVILSVNNGEIIARCPESIFGLAEHCHLGIQPIRTAASAILDLVIDLMPHKELDRMPDPKTTIILGIELPLLHVPCRETTISMNLIAAQMSIMSE